MKEVEWLMTGLGGPKEDFIRDAKSFSKVPQEIVSDELEALHLNCVEYLKLDTLSQDQKKALAQEMRDTLMDYYIRLFLLGESVEKRLLRNVKKRTRQVFKEDHSGILKIVIEEVEQSLQSEGALYPIQACFVQWGEEDGGVVISSIGYDEGLFFNFTVAPIAEFEEKEDSDNFRYGNFPILERRWREFPGGELLQKCLEIALSGDLVGLRSLGFKDRCETGELEVFDFRAGF
jgi:hypothetical protein